MIYRKIIMSRVVEGEPIVSAVAGRWVKQRYPAKLGTDEGIDTRPWAYAPDLLEACVLVFSKNEIMLTEFITEGLEMGAITEVTEDNDEADTETAGWLHKGEATNCEDVHLSIGVEKLALDGVTKVIEYECCAGCKHNEDGKASTFTLTKAEPVDVE